MRAFITGASTGLGEGLARHYAQAGGHIGLVARRQELLEERAREVEEKGATAHIFAADVSDTEAMRKHAETFIQAAGGIDLVVANAGVGIKDGIREGNAEDIRWLVEVNVIGVTNTVVPFVPQMVEQQSGVLCAIGSFAGHQPLPGRSAYAASKAFVRRFMDGVRMDLHGTGVHAMTLCPGFVETPLTADLNDMMFAIDVDEAVRAMTNAITARKKAFTFPWQMNLLKELSSRAPEVLLRRMAPKGRETTMKSRPAD